MGEKRDIDMKWTIGMPSEHGTHNANIIFDENGEGVAQVYDTPMHTTLENVDKKRFAQGLKYAKLIVSAPEQAARIAALEEDKRKLIEALDKLMQIDFVYDLGMSAEYTGVELKQFLAARKEARRVLAEVE